MGVAPGSESRVLQLLSPLAALAMGVAPGRKFGCSDYGPLSASGCDGRRARAWIPGAEVLAAGERVVDEVMAEDLGARAAVVCDVALEPLQVVEAAPDPLIHLHETDRADARANRLDRGTDLDELAPAALLPRGGE